METLYKIYHGQQTSFEINTLTSNQNILYRNYVVPDMYIMSQQLVRRFIHIYLLL